MSRGALPLSEKSLGTTITYLVYFGGLSLRLSVLTVLGIAGRLAVREGQLLPINPRGGVSIWEVNNLGVSKLISLLL